MVRRIPMNVRIDPDLVAAMERVRESEAIPVSEQIRRGILLWLGSRRGARATRSAKKAPKAKARR
jgi:hypothetical protein